MSCYVAFGIAAANQVTGELHDSEPLCDTVVQLIPMPPVARSVQTHPSRPVASTLPAGNPTAATPKLGVMGDGHAPGTYDLTTFDIVSRE